MTVDEIMKLVNAGFTKDEIIKLGTPAADEKPAETPAPAPASAPDPQEDKKEPAEGAEPDIMGVVNKRLEEMEKSLKDYVKSQNVFSIPDIKPVTDVTDIITKFFKEE